MFQFVENKRSDAFPAMRRGNEHPFDLHGFTTERLERATAQRRNTFPYENYVVDVIKLVELRKERVLMAITDREVLV